MSNEGKFIHFVALVMLCAGVANLVIANPVTSSADPMTESEVEKWSITVFPDGRGLPKGSGSAAEGKSLYKIQCVSCHDSEGQGGRAPRLVGKEGYVDARKDLLQAMSVGAWPYATSIFDYIRRAMPHQAPKTLTDDQVYQLTAYILYLNNLVKLDETVDEQSLARINMPNKKKAINAWQKLENDN